MMPHNFIIGPTDTDSISFCKPDMAPFSEKEIKALVDEINEISPECIDWDFDGLFPAVLSLKAKNYVLFDGKEYKFKGSSLVDQKKEIALREMMERICIAMIEGKSQRQLIAIYEEYVKEALDIKDINRWSVKKTITQKVMESTRKNETKVKDAMEGDHFQEGDKIWVYQAIDGEIQQVVNGEVKVYKKTGLPIMKPNKVLKQAKSWKNDEDRLHYVKRVYATIKIFKFVLDIDNFVNYGKAANKTLLDRLINA